MDITGIEDDNDERWLLELILVGAVSKLLSSVADKFEVLLMGVVVDSEPVELLNASNMPSFSSLSSFAETLEGLLVNAVKDSFVNLLVDSR